MYLSWTQEVVPPQMLWEKKKQIIPVRFFIIIDSDFRKHGLLLIYEEQHTCYVYTEAVISFNNDIIFFMRMIPF